MQKKTEKIISSALTGINLQNKVRKTHTLPHMKLNHPTEINSNNAINCSVYSNNLYSKN